MAHSNNDSATAGESSSDGSPTFTLSQLADALELIIHDQAARCRTRNPSTRAETTSGAHDTTDSSTTSLSASQVDAVSTEQSADRPAMPPDASPRDSPPPLEPLPYDNLHRHMMAASNVACCPRHGPPPYPSSSESDNTANTTASTHAPTAASANTQGPTAILTAVSAIPAVAAGGCQGHVLPTGSFGLASGPATLATPATAERWYAVISGRAVGVFEGWHNVSPLVTGVSFAVFQRYTSRAAALAAFSAALAAGTVTVLP